MKSRCYTEIESLEELCQLLKTERVIDHCALQNIDFREVESVGECRFTDTLFIGCTLTEELRGAMGEGCITIPKLPVPYDIFPTRLYDAESLYKGYDPETDSGFEECYDSRIYKNYISNGKCAKDICRTLARSLHDHSISDSLHELIEKYDPRKVVAIMGGHAMLRTDREYLKIARISKQLSEKGFLMCSGGGPGAMEATHIGAWMASRSDQELTEAVDMLSSAPDFKSKGWLQSSFKVIRRFPREKRYCSLGIPTWFYGHEPATPFASHIAKYFDNSIREDELLAIAKGGVIYSPGSAGTMQEIFQDAAQNHYLTHGLSSPMIFLGEKYWQEQMPAYTLLKNLLEGDRYRNLILSITDDEQCVVRSIESFSCSE